MLRRRWFISACFAAFSSAACGAVPEAERTEIASSAPSASAALATAGTTTYTPIGVTNGVPPIAVQTPYCSADRTTSNIPICSGSGSSGVTQTFGCAPYVCDAPTGLCKTSCASASDCAAGDDCYAGSCVARASTCTSETTGVFSNGITFDCGEFICDPAVGACVTSCVSDADCEIYASCNMTVQLCGIYAASAGPDGTGQWWY